jgi:hypothetical protein
MILQDFRGRTLRPLVNKARDGEFYSLKSEVVVVEPVPVAMMLISSANGRITSVLSGPPLISFV